MFRKSRHRHGRLHTVMILALAGLPALSARAWSEEAAVVGTVAQSRPAAGSKLAGEDRAVPQGAAVHRSEQLWTGSGGRVQVTLSDGSAVDLGENARLTLDDFVLPEEGAGKLVLRSLAGALRFAGGAIDKSAPGAVKIVTPVATMTVRGTDFFAGPIDGAYGVFVFHGEVEVATAAGSVSLTDGEGTSVTTSREAPGPVKRWGAAKIARAEKLVGF